jgi:hypothetical protein
MTIKHPTCGGTHESVAEVRDCQFGSAVAATQAVVDTKPAIEARRDENFERFAAAKQANYEAGLVRTPGLVGGATATAARKPASDKQRSYLTSLATRVAEIEGWGRVALDNVLELAIPDLDSREASRQIDSWKAIVDAAPAPKPQAQAPAVDVPAGRYAVPTNEGHYAFYKVDRPTEGRWAGYVFAKQLIGSVGSWSEQRLSRDVTQTILARIATQGVEESARLFGIKARACGFCMSPLSNPQSRAAGYGSTCADNNGLHYPTYTEAVQILGERGEEVETATE